MSYSGKISSYREKLLNKSYIAEIPDEMFSVDFLRQDIMNRAVTLDMPCTIKALEVMEKYHAGSLRNGDGNVPYIIHPLIIAEQAFALGVADDVIVPVCLLHDVLEDTEATAVELEMPSCITEAVQLLTFEKLQGEDNKSAKDRYFENIAGNRVASVVKVLDRCSNVSDMAVVFSENRVRKYIKETEDYVLPLLEMIKDENEDLHEFSFVVKYHIISVLESLKKLL